MKEKKPSLVATVGRFQSPYLHVGHRSVIKRCFAMAASKVLIFVGDSGMNPTEKNPMSFKVREDMIKDYIRENVDQMKDNFIDFEIIQLKDQPFSDDRWCKTLDQLIMSRGYSSNLLVGGRDSFLKVYTGKVKTMEIPEISGKSASEVRDKINIPPSGMFSEKEKQWFRAGIIYGQKTRPYSNLYPVVDCIIWKPVDVEKEWYEVLLGRKHGEEGWRLPGGFVNSDDQMFENAAMREALEEVGQIELDKPKYLTSSFINDRRYESVRDSVYTTVFSMQYIWGAPEAGDDLEEVKWFPMENLPQYMIEEHRTFINNWHERSFS